MSPHPGAILIGKRMRVVDTFFQPDERSERSRLDVRGRGGQWSRCGSSGHLAHHYRLNQPDQGN